MSPHDQVEAVSIFDETVIMNAGAVEQCSMPQAIYARPANRFGRRFHRHKADFADATVLDAATVDGVGDWLVDSPNPAETGLFGVGGPVGLTLSPSSVHVLPL